MAVGDNILIADDTQTWDGSCQTGPGFICDWSGLDKWNVCLCRLGILYSDLDTILGD